MASLSHPYGISAACVTAYRPFWTIFVQVFGGLPVDQKADSIPGELLTDCNMATFIEQQWSDGMVPGSFKKLRASLAAAHQGEKLGKIDWQDSKRFPNCFLICKVCIRTRSYIYI